MDLGLQLSKIAQISKVESQCGRLLFLLAPHQTLKTGFKLLLKLRQIIELEYFNSIHDLGSME